MSLFAAPLPLPPLLRSFVQSIEVNDPAGLSGLGGAYRVMPGPVPVLGFQYRGKLSVRRDFYAEELSRGGISGIQSEARWFLPEAETGSILVRLSPFGAYGLLGIPMSEFADRQLPLADLVPGMGEFLERLRETAPKSSAILVRDWLLKVREQKGRTVHPDLARAARLASVSKGARRVEKIARELGLSRRHLERLFLEQIGVGPKEFFSLLRFSDAMRRMTSGASLAGLALESSYADQAHFIRDFKSRTGQTPGEFIRGFEPSPVFPETL